MSRSTQDWLEARAVALEAREHLHNAWDVLDEISPAVCDQDELVREIRHFIDLVTPRLDQLVGALSPKWVLESE